MSRLSYYLMLLLNLLGILFFSVLLIRPTLASPFPTELEELLHTDVYGTRNQSEALFQKYQQTWLFHLNNSLSTQRTLEEVIHLGRRNLAWLDHLNSFRSEENQLSFSSKETQKGIPIDKPKRYAPKIIVPAFEEVVSELPSQMKKVIIEGATFDDSLEISEQDYFIYGQKIDRLYQTALRWETMSAWLPYLAERKKEDVRGYYYLHNREGLREELANWEALTLETQMFLKPLLVNLCENSASRWRQCNGVFNQYKQNHRLVAYLDQYLSGAEVTYNNFFKLAVRRSDINWDRSDQTLFPFKTPSTLEVQNFLKDNIEEEWQLSNWKLILDFRSNASARVVFKPNATPNVNGLGGNIITMNSLVSLDDYNVQWTIRHEFGHVLGFPDCYIEYYDEDDEVMVNYQIDVDNLMCSRTGHLMDTHYNEMKRVYQR